MDNSALMAAFQRMTAAVKDLLRRMNTVEAKVQRALNQGQGGGSFGSQASAFALAVVGGSSIGPGTTTTPTSATVTVQGFNGTTISSAGNTVTAYSYHDKKIAAASLVGIAWDGSYWWIIDVQSCSDLG